MPIGSKKGDARYGADQSKAQKARGGNACNSDGQKKSPAMRAADDEFGTKAPKKPENKRKQGPTTKNYESKPETGRQWGQTGKG